MSVNKDKPHVLVLPEDRENQLIAKYFWQSIPQQKQRSMQVLPFANGWHKVLDKFEEKYINHLNKYPNGHIILLIDFDGRFEDRLATFQEVIPPHIADRVYVLGSWDEPKTLKRATSKSLDDIGKKLAAECFENKSELWEHEHLKHNASERQRLNDAVKSILF